MGLRVLLVDDDAKFRQVARRVLIADGLDVLADAVDGAGALRSIPTANADVVLLDIGLPDMSGVEVARRLHETPGGPVVVLISTRDVEYGRRVAADVATAYLPKDELSGAAIRALVGL